jgi:hypothetical protein
MDGHVGLSVSEDDAINCVPDSLFTFLNLVYGDEVLPKHVASMHKESTGFPFQKSTDEVGVKIDIRH